MNPDDPPKPAPKPTAATPPPTKRPIVIVKRGWSKSEWLTVGGIFGGLALFLGLAFIFSSDYSREATKDMLDGVVREKYITGETTTEISVSGPNRRGSAKHDPAAKSQVVDTGYSLKVFVPSMDKTYDVTLDKELWDKTDVGKPIRFQRPRAERAR